MSEENYKSPEQISDEDYKVAPTSADKVVQKKASSDRMESSQTGENYELPSALQEELKEGVE